MHCFRCFKAGNAYFSILKQGGNPPPFPDRCYCDENVLKIKPAFKISFQFGYGNANLLHGIPFTDGHHLIFE